MAAHKGAISLPEQDETALSSLWQMLADWDTKGAIFSLNVSAYLQIIKMDTIWCFYVGAVGKRRHTSH